jgi:uncharacterized RDD family membrane protein YckC
MIENARYAGLFRRIAASIVDSIVIAILLILILTGIILIFEVQLETHFSQSIHDFMYDFTSILTGITILLGNFIYYAIFESSKYQGTIGKIIMRIKIVTNQGEKISFATSFFRLLLFYLFAISPFYIINFFTIIFTKEKKALHDMIFNTRIILS